MNTKKRNPQCAACGNLNTQKWGSRNGLKRYRCEQGHAFSIDFRPKPKLLGSYLAGPSVRNIAAESGLKKSAIAEHLKRELSALPQNELITKAYCTCTIASHKTRYTTEASASSLLQVTSARSRGELSRAAQRLYKLLFLF